MALPVNPDSPWAFGQGLHIGDWPAFTGWVPSRPQRTVKSPLVFPQSPTNRRAGSRCSAAALTRSARDTGRGRVVVLRLASGLSGAMRVASIHVDTEWLQDACFDGGRWWPTAALPTIGRAVARAQFAVPVQSGCVLVVALTTSVQVRPASCGWVAVTVICVGVAPVIVNTTPGLPTKFMFEALSVPVACTAPG